VAFPEQLTQSLSIAGNAIYPSNAAANAASSTGNFAMSSFRRCMAKLITGVLPSGATINCVFQSSNVAGGTYTNVANAAVINASNSNSEYTMEIRSDELPTGNSYLRANATVGTTTANYALEIWGGESGYKPANQFDAGDVISRTVSTI
jgi:hypothetical protein